MGLKLGVAKELCVGSFAVCSVNATISINDNEMRTSSACERVSVFSNIERIYVRTVAFERPRASAMASSVLPSMSARTISVSDVVSSNAF